MSKKTLLPLCLCVLFIYTGWIQAQTIDVSGIVVYAEDNEPVILPTLTGNLFLKDYRYPPNL